MKADSFAASRDLVAPPGEDQRRLRGAKGAQRAEEEAGEGAGLLGRLLGMVVVHGGQRRGHPEVAIQGGVEVRIGGGERL